MRFATPSAASHGAAPAPQLAILCPTQQPAAATLPALPLAMPMPSTAIATGAATIAGVQGIAPASSAAGTTATTAVVPVAPHPAQAVVAAPAPPVSSSSIPIHYHPHASGNSGQPPLSSGANPKGIAQRPAVFDKLEQLVRDMQDPLHGVPVRRQKIFLTSIPFAFMGYDLIEWLMDRLSIEDSRKDGGYMSGHTVLILISIERKDSS